MPSKKDTSNQQAKLKIVDHQGQEFDNDKDMANYINNLFINIGKDLASVITYGN